MTTEMGKQTNRTKRGERSNAKKNAWCSECSSSFAGMCTRIRLHFELKMHTTNSFIAVGTRRRTRELLQ